MTVPVAKPSTQTQPDVPKAAIAKAPLWLSRVGGTAVTQSLKGIGAHPLRQPQSCPALWASMGFSPQELCCGLRPGDGKLRVTFHRDIHTLSSQSSLEVYNLADAN